jgi:uncharacterized membrane protein YjgN (DUF898 family)
MKRFEFTGSGTEYFKIWIVNTLLTIVTFGIYYPWAKVRNNRYLYANSMVENKNFEYHATGKQLLFGYLLAISIFFIYNLLSSVFPTAALLFLFLFFIFLPWLILKGMRFNLNMTSFNNVRFNFDGKLFESYIIFLGIPILYILLFILFGFLLKFSKESVILTLLLLLIFFVIYVVAFSYFNVIKTRYFIDFTKYGNFSFDTNLDTPKFIVSIIFTLVFLGIFYLTGYVSDINFIMSVMKENPKEGIKMVLELLFPLLVLGYFLFIFVATITFAYYSVKKREYIFDNTKLNDSVSFLSTMKFFPYAYILITNFILIILSLGFAYPWAKVRVAKYTLDNTMIRMAGGFDDYYSISDVKDSAFADQMNDVLNLGVGVSI